MPLGLSNILFVSTSKGVCRALLALHIPCVVYGNSPDGVASYDTCEFLAKMNVRTNYTLNAVELGYSILQTDTDAVYLRDPFPYFNCAKCHFEALADDGPGYINAGFVYIRSSAITVAVYRAMHRIAIRSQMSADQRNLNNIVKAMRVIYRTLDDKQFKSGRMYYEVPNRYFKSLARDRPECAVAHKNWIVSTQAKVTPRTNFVVTGGNGGCRYDNRCSRQRRQSWLHQHSV